MKKLTALLLALICALTAAGCGTQPGRETTETGYPSGEIQFPEIMYHGQVYSYYATGFDEPLPDGYEYAGSIETVDNINGAVQDFWGARVDVGQKIYASDDNSAVIYVEYKNGYARFFTADTYAFDGKVLEIHEQHLLVEPADDSRESQCSDKMKISLGNAQAPEELEVGDSVTITYDGMIQELYPAIIPNVYGIEKN